MSNLIRMEHSNVRKHGVEKVISLKIYCTNAFIIWVKPQPAVGKVCLCEFLPVKSVSLVIDTIRVFEIEIMYE